jgi:hypothetical protein
MFQYAAARALAIRKKVPFKLDVSAFTTYDLHHGFELARVFNCSADLAQPEDIRKVLGWQASPRFRNLLSRYHLEVLQSRMLITEPSFNYWEGINEVPDDCYLNGYWQSEKYFAEAATVIRNDFVFREPLKNQNIELASLISRVNAVSVHVRRGDYVSDPRTASTHGVCSLEYYNQAIKNIADRFSKIHLFLFSDDIQWVKENLSLDFPCSYVGHNNGVDSFNDLRLMSMCNHHVIANSSFSWWGAWLNPSVEKVVIAPKHWFVKEIDTKDLIPDNWIII